MRVKKDEKNVLTQAKDSILIKFPIFFNIFNYTFTKGRK